MAVSLISLQLPLLVELSLPFHMEPQHSSEPWLQGPSLVCSPENRAWVWQSLKE